VKPIGTRNSEKRKFWGGKNGGMKRKEGELRAHAKEEGGLGLFGEKGEIEKFV